MNSKKTLLFVLIIFLLTFFYDLRISLNKGLIITDDIFASDLMNDRYPVRVELSRALKEGKLALWTTLIYNGFPLQANPESGITYPINIILFSLFEPALALNLSILLKFFLSATFLFLYLRTIGVNHAASLFGGIAFGWCGFFIVHVKQLNMHDAGIWVPLMLVFLEKYHVQKKFQWLILCSLILGLQLLASHPQISYYTILIITAYFLWSELPINRSARGFVKVFIYAVCFILIGVALGMIQLLPTLELTGLSERSGGLSYEFATQLSYYPPDVLTFIYPYIHGDPGKSTYEVPGLFWEDYGYVGILPLAFALYAMVMTFRKNRYTKFFTVVFIISFVLMLGDKGILYKFLFHILPGLNYFRFATRFIFLVDLSLAVLAGIGLANALKEKDNKNYLHFWQTKKHKKDQKSEKLEKDSPKPGKVITKIAYMLIVAVTVGDLYYMQKRQNPVVARDKWEKIPHTAEIIKRDNSLFRIYSIGTIESHRAAYTIAKGWEGNLQPYIEQREFLQPSLNMLWGISSADGYINMVPRYVINMWGNEKQYGLINQTGRMSQDGQQVLTTYAFSYIINAYNIKYLISPWPIVNPNLHLIDSTGGILLYLNRTVMPRAYLVSGAIHLTDENALPALAEGRINPGKIAITAEIFPDEFQGNPFLSNPGEVSIKSYTNTYIELEIDANHNSWLILTDTYYPGWKAFVDDKETKIYRANICSRALPISQGSHKVIFTYSPSSFRTGMLITLLFLLGTGVYIFTNYKHLLLKKSLH